MTEMQAAQLDALVPGWGAMGDYRVLAHILDRLRWRPIAEMTESDGNCLVIDIDNPGTIELVHVCDLDFSATPELYGFTHFQRISLGALEAELLKKEMEA